MSIIWGVTALSHDASLAVLKNNELIFASHSERYSRIKNDAYLNVGIINEALSFGSPDYICFYERPWLKKARQITARQWDSLFDKTPKHHLEEFIKKPIVYSSHHKSHAAAGYYTSNFNDAVILCLDSVGEFETMSIWQGRGKKLIKRHSQHYPHSIGFWYSAMTQRIGLKPQEHEYILMGMAAKGDPNRFYNEIKTMFFAQLPTIENPDVYFKVNLHRGCKWWMPELNEDDYFDVAAATQKIYEEIFLSLLLHIKNRYKNDNIVLMGGSILNCVANTIALEHFKNVWIMPNPGDAGSAIGAILAQTKKFIEWPGAFLGHDISGKYPTNGLLRELLTNRITGVASGKAEFGPRALGNRSLLADPRGDDIKDLVNKAKYREPFRPFAPAILEEYVHEYFDVPKGFKSPYMQYTVKCKYPDKFPAIVHFDNTSRVQTVSKTDNPGFRQLLESWYYMTGCPMLLNTSLNIKGEPLVNSLEDAKRWEQKYQLKICLPNTY